MAESLGGWCRAIIVVAALTPAASVAVAQDLPTTQLQDHAQVVRQGILVRSLLKRRSARSTMLSPQARATCANKGRAAAKFGMGDPKVRRLYALCARVGL